MSDVAPVSQSPVKSHLSVAEARGPVVQEKAPVEAVELARLDVGALNLRVREGKTLRRGAGLLRACWLCARGRRTGVAAVTAASTVDGDGEEGDGLEEGPDEAEEGIRLREDGADGRELGEGDLHCKRR
jgi:hypothetical protein